MTKKLKFQLNGEKQEIELIEKELKMFSGKSNFLNKKANDWEIKKSFFDKNSAVPDVFRYILKYTSNGVWKFFDTNEKDADKFEITYDLKEIPTEGAKNIILILESPHKDEYEIINGKLKPKSPASGDSGKAIYALFTSHVLPILNSLGLELNKSEKYNFCIVNPVPYQTSLISIHQKSLDTGLRDKVWEVMYHVLRKDFKSRLKKYKPFAVLNGCTSNLKDLLKDDIYEITKCNIFNVSHPASWTRSLSGFKIPEKSKKGRDS